MWNISLFLNFASMFHAIVCSQHTMKNSWWWNTKLKEVVEWVYKEMSKLLGKDYSCVLDVG